MAARSNKSTTGTLVVEITADTTANRTVRSVNPNITDSVFVDGMKNIGDLQSHTVQAYRRQNKAEIIEG